MLKQRKKNQFWIRNKLLKHLKQQALKLEIEIKVETQNKKKSKVPQSTKNFLRNPKILEQKRGSVPNLKSGNLNKLYLREFHLRI